jgi:hypothetical protein
MGFGDVVLCVLLNAAATPAWLLALAGSCAERRKQRCVVVVRNCAVRLVPYSFAGQLRDAAETTAQLQALSSSRPVPPKVRARLYLWVLCICCEML